jgi:hypothetical protein
MRFLVDKTIARRRRLATMLPEGNGMRTTSFLIAACLVAACAAAGSNQEKSDASNDPHDAPTSKQDGQAIDAPAVPIDAPVVPIDAPVVSPDASDIGADCFFNSQCPDTNTCCFFGQCAVGVAGANNTCIP